MQKRTEVVVPLTQRNWSRLLRHQRHVWEWYWRKDWYRVISTDVADQPGALPLLQYALTELFERREGRMLTGEAYQSIGGVLGALGRRAEEVYGGLDEIRKEASRQLFLRLVTLGEGAEDTRRRVLRTELEGVIGDRGQRVGDREKSVIGDQHSVISDQYSVIRNQGSTISNVIDVFGGCGC